MRSTLALRFILKAHLARVILPSHLTNRRVSRVNNNRLVNDTTALKLKYQLGNHNGMPDASEQTSRKYL